MEVHFGTVFVEHPPRHNHQEKGPDVGGGWWWNKKIP